MDDPWLAVLGRSSNLVALVSLTVIGLCLLFARARPMVSILVRNRLELGLIFLAGALVRGADLLGVEWFTTFWRVVGATVSLLTAAALLVRLWRARHEV